MIQTTITTPPPDADHARRVVRRLLRVDHRLPDELRRDILALGTAAVPALVEILEDEELSLSEAPGTGWAPAHSG